MKSIAFSCPKCNNSQTFYRYGKDVDGYQKYLCLCCKHQFAPEKHFCGADGWELYKNTDHYFYRKRKLDGTVKYTKVSKGSEEIHSNLWKQVLKRQLQVTQAEFNQKI